MPPPSSTAIAMMAPSCGSGRCFEAMYPTVPSKVPILPKPEVMNMTASRMRPTSAAVLVVDEYGTVAFMLFSLVGLVGESRQVEQQHFGIAALLQPHHLLARSLERIAMAQRIAVHGDFPAHDVDVAAAPGARTMLDHFGAVHQRGVEGRVLADGDGAF